MTMRLAGLAAVAAASLWAGAAPAQGPEAAGGEAERAIRSYCEPLIGGASAAQVSQAALGAGYRADVMAGQRVLLNGETILALSDAPRVCFVQAPAAMTRAEGFALADAWAARHPGARRAAANAGPDGRPARGWSVPARGLSLIATEQQAAPGRTVMAFVLMPMPEGAAAAR
jgi:hypothetical protein